MTEQPTVGMVQCIWCDKPLTGGKDTYGEYGYPECFDCFWDVRDSAEQCWYGVAPHTHDLSKTGSMIGSTVLTPITLNGHGEHDCGNGVWFRTDPDAPGCGVYTRKR